MRVLRLSISHTHTHAVNFIELAMTLQKRAISGDRDDNPQKLKKPKHDSKKIEVKSHLRNSSKHQNNESAMTLQKPAISGDSDHNPKKLKRHRLRKKINNELAMTLQKRPISGDRDDNPQKSKKPRLRKSSKQRNNDEDTTDEKKIAIDNKKKGFEKKKEKKNAIDNKKKGFINKKEKKNSINNKKKGFINKKKNAIDNKKKGFINKKENKNAIEFPEKLIGKDGKPEWKKVKMERLKVKKNRKIHRTGEEQYNLSMEAKNKWEMLRIRKKSKEERLALVTELYTRLKNQIPVIVQSHDMARVAQWLLKLGSDEIRTEICNALCTNTKLYMKSKFAHHVISKALRYSSETCQQKLVEACKGDFVKLISNSFAKRLVELMYTTYASPDQRKQMKIEFYGKMHALLPSDVDTIDKIPSDIKPSIISSTKKILTKLLADKKVLTSTLVQSVANDFLTNCSEEDRMEIAELLHGDVLALCQSKEGCRVALTVVWSATNKMKKVIVKSIKGQLKTAASSKEMHLLMMGLFDSVDDTVLVNKVLIPELLDEGEDLVKNEYGRKVILYLVAHRDPKYFHPDQLSILKKGDEISKRKKDNTLRKKEMLDAVSGPLLKRIANDPASWLVNSSVSMVTLAILKSGTGPALDEALECITKYVLDPSTVIEVIEDKKPVAIIEDSGIHMVLKKLIKQDKDCDNYVSDTFSKILVSNTSKEILEHLLQFNRGCFLLVLLLETEKEDVCNELKSKLEGTLTTLLKKQQTKGADILLNKLSNLK